MLGKYIFQLSYDINLRKYSVYKIGICNTDIDFNMIVLLYMFPMPISAIRAGFFSSPCVIFY